MLIVATYAAAMTAAKNGASEARGRSALAMGIR